MQRLRRETVLVNDLWRKAGGTTMIAAEDGAHKIIGLTCDSRDVKPGYLFAALPGLQSDGRDFISDALERGAVCILAASGTILKDNDVSLLVDDNPRRRFSQMAAKFFDARPRTVVAVTGTNGKTSVVTLTRQIWTKLGRSAASMGTLGVSVPNHEAVGSLTTPDPVGLHHKISDLAKEGINCLAIEASSHGLSQYRLDGVNISCAAFTNLSREHLDYHDSMAEYLTAKSRLFSEVMPPDGVAVLNADAPEFRTLAAICSDRGQSIISYGLKQGDIRCEKIISTQSGFDLEIFAQGKKVKISFPLIGSFQIANALCAAGLVIASGEDAGEVLQTLSSLEGAPGRLQKIVGHPKGASVYIDYAHTPDALETVLKALRPHVTGNISVVFGCGGDRDQGKRPEMGLVAQALADRIIVTDDNPRSEDPLEIRRQILAACPLGQEIGDRKLAISQAFVGLAENDLLLIAGKGHEASQIVGDQVLPFSDFDVASKAMAGITL
jgi:UDP-N-acetylmuramoyl-L-alanyl-D-glutamate--2,6-diaminopimelate ligase